MHKIIVEEAMKRRLLIAPAAALFLGAFLLAACEESVQQVVQKTEPRGAPKASPAAPTPVVSPPVVSARVALAPVVVKTPEPPKPDANAKLAHRVKQALEGETRVQAAAIDVTASTGGIITLWGTVDSDDERVRAGRVAYRVRGVNTVNNRLAIVKGS